MDTRDRTLVERLQKIAVRHGLTADAAEQHRAAVWAARHGSIDRLPAVSEAWEAGPGHYSYFDAASALAQALRAPRE
jgi:hypothetical protein